MCDLFFWPICLLNKATINNPGCSAVEDQRETATGLPERDAFSARLQSGSEHPRMIPDGLLH